MSDNKSEISITVPAELTRQCKGLAIDFGGSALKFVYRTAEDANEVKSKDVNEGHLHMAMFARSEVDRALEFVSQRAVVTRTDPTPTVYTTGFGCTQFGKAICDKLNIRLEQISEFDCFVKSFIYLTSRLSRSELLEPFQEDAIIEPIEFARSQADAFQAMTEEKMVQAENCAFNREHFETLFEEAIGRPSAEALDRASAGGVPLVDAEPDVLPCLMAIGGSAFLFIKIEKDGKFNLMDLLNRGGRSFLGMGSLLTKGKSYEELVELAAKGDPQTVDQYNVQMFESMNAMEGDDGVYMKYVNTKPALVFHFGNAIGSNLEELRREDVARAWLNYCVLDFVHLSQSMAERCGVKRLFLCGGFCQHPLVRRIFTQEYVRRNLFRLSMNVREFARFDFMKPGPYLGALGCAINDVDKFIGK